MSCCCRPTYFLGPKQVASILPAFGPSADWNLEPDELTKSGLLEVWDGETVTPSGCSATCTLGSGSLIDYVVVKRGFADQLRVKLF
eukprot:3579657-Pyramimonas_sp.AAC.1